MKRSPVALGVAILLFVGWMGFLASKAWEYRKPPVIVSRAQMLNSKVEAAAFVSADERGNVDPEVTVTEILSAAEGAPKPAADAKIRVVNLADCDGFVGPGSYVLLLDQLNDKWFVVGLPIDPGRISSVKARIYPLSEKTKAQIGAIRNQPRP